MTKISNNLKGFLGKYLPFIDNQIYRETWVSSKLKDLPRGWKILDAGAGECRYSKYCRHLKYTSQDFCQYNGRGDGIGLQTDKWDTTKIDIVSDISNIPVPDASFDSILCSEVIEHIPTPISAIEEFSRIIKPKGKLILTAPFCSQTHFAPYHFYSGFNSYWYKEVLEKNSFRVIEIVENGNYFDFILQELLRTPRVFVKYSSIGVLSNFLYLFILPVASIIWVFSSFSKNSEKQLCFGYHVLAEKTNENI